MLIHSEPRSSVEHTPTSKARLGNKWKYICRTCLVYSYCAVILILNIKNNTLISHKQQGQGVGVGVGVGGAGGVGVG